jgi:acyl-[acyl carrier protein]--UDP-N-acetylglucosamine O-acyltransferase
MTIHSLAVVSEKAVIGKNVTIGPFTIVHDFSEYDMPLEMSSDYCIGSGCSDFIRQVRNA